VYVSTACFLMGLLKDLVDKLGKDVNENCIMDFDFFNDSNEQTLKQKKIFLSF